MNDETPKSAAEIEFDDLKMPDPAMFCFSLVLAEVIFSTKKGVSSHRVQLLSKADVPTFPAARVSQLQNSAAHQAKGEVGESDFQALEVILHNILNLGWMTDEQFHGSKANIPAAAEATTADGEAPGEDSSNVVALKRP